MPEPASSITNLTKVSLNIHTKPAMNSDEKGSPFTFIFGINPAGFTPFEKALYGKRVGDQLDLDLAQADFCETIGHLAGPLREQASIDGTACMRITVTGVSRAEDREVVKAMAGGGSCGDCDCGCGGH